MKVRFEAPTIYIGKTAKFASDCPDGGIGRRAGLKHLWQQCRVGSSPTPGTKKSGENFSAFFILRSSISTGKELLRP